MSERVTVSIARPHVGAGGRFFQRGERLAVTENEARRLERACLAYRVQALAPATPPVEIKVQAQPNKKQAAKVRDALGRYLRGS